MFIEELSGSEDPNVQLLFIRAMDSSTRRMLKSTVLGSEACVAYCQLINMYSSFNIFELEALFSVGSGLQDGGSQETRIQSQTWTTFFFWLGILLSSFSEA